MFVRRSSMKQSTFIIKGLDCPKCAARVEEALCKDERIKTASIDILGGTLKITFHKKEIDFKELSEMVSKAKEGAKLVENEENSYKKPLIDGDMFLLIARIFVAVLIVIIGFFFIAPLAKNKYGERIDANYYLLIGLYVVGYLLVSYDVLWKFILSFKNIKGILNEITLMVVATISAFALRHFPEAILVMIFFQIGNIIEQLSITKSRNLIASTIDKREEYASIYDSHKQLIKTKTTNIKEGDIIAIKVGDVIPVDGVVVSGEGNIDTSSVTGEFVLEQASKDSTIYSGTVLKSGYIDIRATSTYENSTTSKILKMVMESNEHKSKAEKFITKFASWYTPIVIIVAVLVAVIPALIISLSNGFTWLLWEKWILIGLTILVTACPCAVIISVPLTYFMGTALAFKKGIVVKGANYLERLNDVNIVVSDKTGTLTNGKFEVQSINLVDLDEETFAEYLYILESRSSHPIALAIKESIDVKNLANTSKNYEELPGLGVKCEYKGHNLMLGNELLLKQNNIAFDISEEEGTILYLAVDNKFEGYVVMDDGVKANAKHLVTSLKDDGVRVVLLTGGKDVHAQKVCQQVGISEYKASMLPEDKVEFIRHEMNNNEKGKALMYVGDGINDTPCIALADIGVSMGEVGSSASVEESDIVILNDDPIKIEEGRVIAKKTRNRAILNIVVALLVKVVVMVLAALSIVGMWVAVLADTGLLVVLIISSILLIKSKIDIK